MRRRSRWTAGLLVAAGLLGSTAIASGVTIPLPSLEATFSAGVAPTRISKTEPAPVSLQVGAHFRMRDESHPPALKEFKLHLDKHLKPELKGLPVCRGAGSLEPRPPDLSSCREAIVGHGKMATEIVFPEGPPIHQVDKMVAYNTGTKGGVSSLLLYVETSVPVPGAIVSPMKVKRIRKGRYETEAVVTVPKIAGGSGSVTYLGIRFRKGIFSAVCRDGRLQVRSEADFADGSRLTGAVVRFCSSSD